MSDYGERARESVEKQLELRLKQTYTQAQKDILRKLDDFTSKFNRKDKIMRSQMDKGLISEDEYQRWLAGQVFMGAQWEEKVKDITDMLCDVRGDDLKMIHDSQISVFKDNANYQAYKMEHDIGKNFGFDLYDEDTVKRLIREKPELLPRKIVDKKKHNFWNQGIISNCVTQGIIQGESIPKIAKRIANTTANHDLNASTLYARTAMTSAQNSGRMEMLREAKDKGINVKKKWMSTHDARTRDSHVRLDGQVQEVEKPFKSDFGKIEYPGDPKAHPGDVYNCRCTLVYVYPDYEDMSQFSDLTEEEKAMTIDEFFAYEIEQQGRKYANAGVLSDGITKNNGFINQEVNGKKIKSLADFDSLDYDDKIESITQTINNHTGEWEESEIISLGERISHTIDERTVNLTKENAEIIFQREKKLAICTKKYEELDQKITDLQKERKTYKYGSTEYKKIDRQIKKTMGEFAKLGDERAELLGEIDILKNDKTTAFKQVLARVRNVGGIDDYHLSDYCDFRYLYGSSWERDTVIKGIHEALNVYPSAWLEASKANTITLKPLFCVGRQSYNHDGRIFITEVTKSNIHEVSHRMSHSIAEISRLENDFYTRRTKGCPLEVILINDKGEEEYGRKDKFFNEYIGKDYGSKTDFEIMSVGCSTVLTNYQEMEKDMDMLHFVLGVMFGV